MAQKSRTAKIQLQIQIALTHFIVILKKKMPKPLAENTVRCPYIPEHVMAVESLMTHLTRCKATNKHLFRACVYNCLHVVPRQEYDSHIKVCPDRTLVTQHPEAPPLRGQQPQAQPAFQEEDIWQEKKKPKRRFDQNINRNDESYHSSSYYSSQGEGASLDPYYGYYNDYYQDQNYYDPYYQGNYYQDQYYHNQYYQGPNYQDRNYQEQGRDQYRYNRNSYYQDQYHSEDPYMQVSQPAMQPPPSPPNYFDPRYRQRVEEQPEIDPQFKKYLNYKDYEKPSYARDRPVQASTTKKPANEPKQRTSFERPKYEHQPRQYPKSERALPLRPPQQQQQREEQRKKEREQEQEKKPMVVGVSDKETYEDSNQKKKKLKVMIRGPNGLEPFDLDDDLVVFEILKSMEPKPEPQPKQPAPVNDSFGNILAQQASQLRRERKHLDDSMHPWTGSLNLTKSWQILDSSNWG